MPIDHVLIAAPDPPTTARRLWERHGLRAIPGGVHPGWGTGNWIVPLGSAYLELVHIVDPELAARSPFGQAALRALANETGPYAWCVAPLDFDATVRRLGLRVGEGSRQRPDGVALAWRTAGLEIALADASRPFFIGWRAPAEAHPGRSPAAHRSIPNGIASLRLSGDEPAVRAWLGGEPLQVTVQPGPAAVLEVTIAMASGPLTLAGGSLA